MNSPNKWNPDSRVKTLLKDTGFDKLLGICLDIRHNLSIIDALAKSYNVTDRCFHFNDLTLVPTLEDVFYITGLPVDGKPVIGADGTAEALTQRYLDKEFSYSYIPGSVNLKWLQDSFEIVPPNEKNIEPYVRAFVLYLIGTIICPYKSGYVPAMFLSVLANINELRTYAWGAALLAHLHWCMEQYKDKDHKSLGGQTFFLMIFALERIPLLRPKFGVSQDSISLPKDFPLFVSWAALLQKALRNPHIGIKPEDVLPNLTNENIVWQPYQRFSPLSDDTVRHSQLGKSRSILLCFEKFIYQRPDLCPKQFGLSAVNVRKPMINVGKIKFRSGRKKNWTEILKEYMEEWDKRFQLLIDGVSTGSSPLSGFEGQGSQWEGSTPFEATAMDTRFEGQGSGHELEAAENDRQVEREYAQYICQREEAAEMDCQVEKDSIGDSGPLIDEAANTEKTLESIEEVSGQIEDANNTEGGGEERMEETYQLVSDDDNRRKGKGVITSSEGDEEIEHNENGGTENHEWESPNGFEPMETRFEGQCSVQEPGATETDRLAEKEISQDSIVEEAAEKDFLDEKDDNRESRLIEETADMECQIEIEGARDSGLIDEAANTERLREIITKYTERLGEIITKVSSQMEKATACPEKHEGKKDQGSSQENEAAVTVCRKNLQEAPQSEPNNPTVVTDLQFKEGMVKESDQGKEAAVNEDITENNTWKESGLGEESTAFSVREKIHEGVRDEEGGLCVEAAVSPVRPTMQGKDKGHLSKATHSEDVDTAVSGSGPRRNQERDQIPMLMIDGTNVRREMPTKEPAVIEVQDSPEVEHIEREDSIPRSSARGNTSTARPVSFEVLISAAGAEIPRILEKIQAAANDEIDSLRIRVVSLEEELARTKLKNAQLMMDSMDQKGKMKKMEEKTVDLEEKNGFLEKENAQLRECLPTKRKLTCIYSWNKKVRS